MAKLAQHNSANGNTYVLGVNKFTDYTPEEYRRLLGYKKSAASLALQETYLTDVTAPESIDWREKGAVTPVKD